MSAFLSFPLSMFQRLGISIGNQLDAGIPRFAFSIRTIQETLEDDFGVVIQDDTAGASDLAAFTQHPFTYTAGRGGSDNIFGRGSDDIILGEGGNDTINGRLGDDVLFGGTGNDDIRGGGGFDYLDGGDGNDALVGDAGGDILFGRAGSDFIRAGVGNDFASGGAGDDNIAGGRGRDTLEGGDGSDFLNGNYDDDTIFGGSGNDVLRGGGGNDLFVFDPSNAHEGADLILDFQLGKDAIAIEAANILASTPGIADADGVDGFSAADLDASHDWFLYSGEHGQLGIRHPGGTIEIATVDFDPAITFAFLADAGALVVL